MITGLKKWAVLKQVSKEQKLQREAKVQILMAANIQGPWLDNNTKSGG